MAELTPEAKAEIAEAIRIVREDRFEQYVRNRTAGAQAPAPGAGAQAPAPGAGAPVADPPPDPNLPPKKDEPPKEDPPKKVGLYWPASEED